MVRRSDTRRDLKEQHPWQREQQRRRPRGRNKHGVFISWEGQLGRSRMDGRDSTRLMVKGSAGEDHTGP